MRTRASIPPELIDNDAVAATWGHATCMSRSNATYDAAKDGKMTRRISMSSRLLLNWQLRPNRVRARSHQMSGTWAEDGLFPIVVTLTLS